MTDDLYSRALSEVERAMADEPHDPWCAGDGCHWRMRLASRLARMLAAGMHEVYVITQVNAETAEIADPNNPLDAGLRAVAVAREAL